MEGEKGRPRSFKSGQEFLNKVIEYAEYCEENEKFINIAGFCRYCDIHKDTYYQQREYYSDYFKKAEAVLEDEVLQSKDITTKIFYLKNKFGYADKVENTNTNTNKNIDLGRVSTDDLKKLIEDED